VRINHADHQERRLVEWRLDRYDKKKEGNWQQVSGEIEGEDPERLREIKKGASHNWGRKLRKKLCVRGGKGS